MKLRKIGWKKITAIIISVIIIAVFIVSFAAMSTKKTEMKTVKATYSGTSYVDFDYEKYEEEQDSEYDLSDTISLLSSGINTYSSDGSSKETASGDYTESYAENSEYYSDEASSDINYDIASDYDSNTAGTSGSSSLSNLEVKGDYLHWTHDVSVETVNYDDVNSMIADAVEKADGYVESSNEMTTSYNDTSGKEHTVRRGIFVIRIPEASVENIDEILNQYSEITGKNSYCDDLTKSYIDTDTKIQSLKDEREKLESLLKDAENVQDVLSINDRISEIDYELESYNEYMDTLKTDVQYSTYNLILDEVLYYQNEITYYTSNALKNWGETAEIWFTEILPEVFFTMISIIPLAAVIIFLIVLAVRNTFKYKVRKQLEIEEEFRTEKETKIL